MTLTYPSLHSDSLQNQLARSGHMHSHPILVLGSYTSLNLTVTPWGCPEMQKAPPPQPQLQPYLCLPCQSGGGERRGSPSSQHGYCLTVIIHHLEIQVLVVFPPLHLPARAAFLCMG